MRFKQFILEQSTLSLEDVIARIREECQSYLTRNPTYPIYRGIPAKHMRLGYTPHPEFRKPRDSGLEFNFTFNAGYQIAFDVPSVRTRCVFATGEGNETSEYGELGFFFPVGDFKFGWSPIFPDSFSGEDKLEQLVGSKFIKLADVHIDGNPGARLSQLFNVIQEKITPVKWIRNFNDEGEDITLQAAKICSFPNIPGLYLKLIHALEEAFTELYFDNEELEKAVDSGHEILFYKTDGYWMVPYSVVQEEMKKEGMEGTHFNRQERYDWLIKKMQKQSSVTAEVE